MPGHSTYQPDGSGVRGLTLYHMDERGRQFGRLFKGKAVEAATFNDDDLFELAKAMKGDGEVKDGPDREASDIPAAYTYFGQFIDHDSDI
jgi:hypothetical protein